MARRSIRALILAGAVAGLLTAGVPAATGSTAPQAPRQAPQATQPAAPTANPAECSLPDVGEVRTGPAAASSAASCGFTTVAAGYFHACGITRAAGVACWGWNNFGQLGNGTTAASRVPVDVLELPAKAVSIALGGYHTCAVLVTGEAKCWGMNANGALGDGTLQHRSLPVTPTGLETSVGSLAAGYTHTCAIVAGAAKCWGLNYHGQLGIGSTTGSRTPAAVNHLAGVRSIAAGEQHTCAALSGGAAKCWGYNAHGQLGLGDTADRVVPTAVPELGSGVKSLSAGMNHTCAVTREDTAACWGRNASGQLGDGTATLDGRPDPTPVRGLPAEVAVRSVQAGGSHSCAVLASGAAWCWGFNESGQIGDGTFDGRLDPTPVRGLGAGVTQIRTGAQFSCALVPGGQISCWGSNRRGQLGNSDGEGSTEPSTVV